MTKKAILFGVNNYKDPNVSDLRGCVNDVENISDLLVEEFGFRADNVRARTDEEVTLDRVTDDWRWLVKNAKRGDQLVFHFSGHGSQVEDRDNEEKDGLDEILCLYDMDFDDPDTYLVDDQIHTWTKKLPDGVKLTFLLDCCHSGTGTRSLNPGLQGLDRSLRSLPLVVERASAARADLAEVRRATKRRGGTRRVGGSENANDANLVLARYLVPPPSVYERVERSASRSTEQRDTNHVRFSGCKDKQTSADAFIDGDFQGAFSAHFRKTVEDEGSDVSHAKLIRQIRSTLDDAGFEQTPQMNPAKLNSAVFQGLDDDDRDSFENDCGGATKDDSISSDIRTLISKVDDLVETIESRLDGQQRERPRRKSKRSRNVGERSIVYVHGICWHDEGYSDDWFEALRPHLSRDLANELARNHEEVLWSRHVSSGPRGLGEKQDRAIGRKEEEQQLADELQDILYDRAAQAIELQMPPSQSRGARSEIQCRDLDRALFGIPGVDCVDDFLKYLLSNKKRRRVIGEFTQVVEPLLEAGNEIEVISHSWGTVVALEALHQLSEENYDGHVNNFFTVGSALSIRLIQRRLKFGAETGEKPSLVNNWVNLDARGDIVGGTLRGFSSDVDAEYLNLAPVGCREGMLGVSASCAHSSYFEDRNLVVNRDIFAEQIE